MNTALKVQEEVLEVTDALDSLDELDAMFEELEAGSSATAEAELVIEEELSDAELEEVGVVASIEEARNEALAEMDEVGEPVDDAAALATGVIEAAPAKAKRTAPATKRIVVMGAKKSEALTKALGEKLNDYLALSLKNAALDPDDLKIKVDAKLAEIDTLPVKIQEKVVNLYAHLAQGAALSNYTKIAVDLLVKNGEITSKGLRDAYVARPYSVGTANSQCTQLMKVLQVLELAVKDGGKLVSNPDSLLLPMLSA